MTTKNLKEEINMENKYYIIRGDRSGVFFGQIAGRNGQEVELRNVRKLWYWEGACAVEQLAVERALAKEAYDERPCPAVDAPEPVFRDRRA